jgi:hypothetical protein
MTTHLIDWLIPALIGLTFTALALFKLYGLKRGIIGGQEKPVFQKLCGT